MPWAVDRAVTAMSESRLTLQIGDSLTRYQYLSLAHFLARGMWPERCTTSQLCAPGWNVQSAWPMLALRDRCAMMYFAGRCRYGASTEFGRSICIETEFNHDWCACMAVMRLVHNQLLLTAC